MRDMFYALRVSQFLAFANRNTERDIEIVVQEFLDQMKARDNVSEELVRQAQDAIRLYLYHYKDGIRFIELRSAGAYIQFVNSSRYIRRDKTLITTQALFIQNRACLS